MEDEILYSYIQNPISYIEYLQDVLSFEIEYGLSEYDISKWHTLLQEYFSQKPTKESVSQFVIGTGFTQ